jgi:hypothetical protein
MCLTRGTRDYEHYITMRAAISPTHVRYIKLGAGGHLEKVCVERGIIRIGFDTERPERLRLCQAQRWDDLAESFKQEDTEIKKGTVTSFTNQVRLFFEDDGSTLWITFVGERLYWGFVDSASQPTASPDLGGVFRTIRDGWSCVDIHGEALTKDRLSGALTMLAAFRGTSCYVKESDYVVRRINGQKTPAVERALIASKEMKESAVGLMHHLGWQDFELLVDLVFTTSGWRRVGIVGKTTKTLDIDLVLPSTGDRAFVQVKAKTSSQELAEYVDKIEDGPYDRMFYVFHSGEAETGDSRVTLIGPEKLADLVMDAGLVGWLIRKVS